MVQFFSNIPGNLPFLQKFTFEMDYQLNNLACFLAFEKSEMDTDNRRFPIKYIKICFLQYSS